MRIRIYAHVAMLLYCWFIFARFSLHLCCWIDTGLLLPAAYGPMGQHTAPDELGPRGDLMWSLVRNSIVSSAPNWASIPIQEH